MPNTLNSTYIEQQGLHFTLEQLIKQQSRDFANQVMLYLDSFVAPPSNEVTVANSSSGKIATAAWNLGFGNSETVSLGTSGMVTVGTSGTVTLGSAGTAPFANNGTSVSLLTGSSGTLSLVNGLTPVGNVESGNLGTFFVEYNRTSASFASSNSGTFTIGNPGTLASIGQLFDENANLVLLTPHDPWLLATWDLIASHRNLDPGWDGMNAIVPKREWLDTAEALAIQMSSKPMHSRPHFAVGSDGHPSFSIYDDRLYLHLTIDEANRISWYAVSGGVESFEDDVAFDGEELPSQLEQLLGA